MTTIELQAKRLNIINSLRELDKEGLSKLESLIQSLKEDTNKQTYKMPHELLIAFAERANEDFKNGNCITQEELEKEIETW